MKPESVFVYGTLQRGQCRASMWPVQPLSVQEGVVTGSLFGRPDYPALRVGDDRVLGQLWMFGELEIERVLKTLDQIEGANQPGANDLYHRVITDVFSFGGTPMGQAFTYLYATDPVADGFTLIRPNADGYVVWPAVE